MFQFCSYQHFADLICNAEIKLWAIFRYEHIATASFGFHRTARKTLQIINFRQIHFARGCCISETAFPAEPGYIPGRN
jgi:hypothetical protein